MGALWAPVAEARTAMTYFYRPLQVILFAGLTTVCQGLFAQSALMQPGVNVPRTSAGLPDLHGIWDFRTITPLQRPESLDYEVFASPEAAAAFRVAEVERVNRDNFTNPAATGDYNDFWYDRGVELTPDLRTSLIMDPPNGRIPALTPAAQERLRVAAVERELAVGVETRPLEERCLMGFNAGPPMLPSAYNNNMQLVQTGDHVVIVNEMVHDARIVKMDVDTHRDVPRRWEGDSIGRWEGDVLIVETRNFKGPTSFYASSENMELTERFWMIDADTLGYQFTINDPTTFTAPWTAMFPMSRSSEPMYEYACHEGNYSLPGILGGFRTLERLEAEI